MFPLVNLALELPHEATGHVWTIIDYDAGSNHPLMTTSNTRLAVVYCKPAIRQQVVKPGSKANFPVADISQFRRQWQITARERHIIDEARVDTTAPFHYGRNLPINGMHEDVGKCAGARRANGQTTPITRNLGNPARNIVLLELRQRLQRKLQHVGFDRWKKPFQVGVEQPEVSNVLPRI